MVGLVLSGLVVAVTIFALLDVITSESWQVKHLDKIVWILLIVFIPLAGVIIWFAVGKDRGSARGGFSRGESSEFLRPAAPAPSAGLSDAEIDAEVERQIEFHEREARLRRLEAELKERREAESGPDTTAR